MATVEINQALVNTIYKETPHREVKRALEHIFGRKFLIPNVTDRLKSWEDVFNELSVGEQYKILFDKELTPREELELIIKALNEGWEPEFTPGENRYYVVASSNIDNPSYQIIEERNPLTDKPKEYALKSYDLARHVDLYFHKIVYMAFKGDK